MKVIIVNIHVRNGTKLRLYSINIPRLTIAVGGNKTIIHKNSCMYYLCYCCSEMERIPEYVPAKFVLP